MKTAKLHDGSIVTAGEYNEARHSTRLFCIDPSCQTPVIFVPDSETATAHFKTIGKGESKHVRKCGFYRPLSLIETIKKTHEYQQHLLEQGVKEQVIRLNMKSIDPDYEPKQIDRQTETKSKKDEDIKAKQDSTPGSVSSLKSLVKLLTAYSPDILSSLIVNIGGGRKFPLSEVVVDQKAAHDILWGTEGAEKRGFFVYGNIEKVIHREKVCYVNFEPVDNVDFTLVVFERYFKHFTYTHEDLEGKQILTYGHLRKNDYKGTNKTEMVIKSNKYIEEIKGMKEDI